MGLLPARALLYKRLGILLPLVSVACWPRLVELLKKGQLMKIAALVCRILLGLGFVVFGLNILYPFLPQPPFPEGSPEAQFMALMVPTHWMALVGLVQLIGGLLVLIGRTAPLGLTLLAPVLVNILAFHICIQGGAGIAPGLVFSALELFLMYAYRDHFKPLLSTNAQPSV